MEHATRIDGRVPSSSLKARLEYEAQRLDTDIAFEVSRRETVAASSFVPKPKIHLQRAGDGWEVEVPVPDSDASVDVLARRPEVQAEEAEHITDADGTALAVVIGRDIFLNVDFADLLDNPDQIETDGLEISSEEATRRLFDSIVEPALAVALEHIEAYEYEQERSRFVAAKLEGRRQHCDSWKRELRDKRSELDHASNRVERLARQMADLRDRIEAFEDHADATVRDRMDREFDELMQMVPEPFVHLLKSHPQLVPAGSSPATW